MDSGNWNKSTQLWSQTEEVLESVSAGAVIHYCFLQFIIWYSILLEWFLKGQKPTSKKIELFLKLYNLLVTPSTDFLFVLRCEFLQHLEVGCWFRSKETPSTQETLFRQVTANHYYVHRKMLKVVTSWLSQQVIVGQSLFWADLGLPGVCVCVLCVVCLDRNRTLDLPVRFLCYFGNWLLSWSSCASSCMKKTGHPFIVFRGVKKCPINSNRRRGFKFIPHDWLLLKSSSGRNSWS